MAPLTLVPADLAKRGHRFTFTGPNKGGECDPCPYQKLCFGLAPNRTYSVTGVRDVTHPCFLHEPGKVRVVTVEEVPFTSTVERRHLRGTAAVWEPIPCRRPTCAKWALCHPVGPKADAKHAIVSQKGAVECPAGFDIERVELKLME